MPLQLAGQDTTVEKILVEMSMAEVYRGMLVGKKEIFQLALDGKARKFALLNIVIVGILYGLSNLFGALKTTPDLPLTDKFAIITPLIFSTAGVVTISAALIGFTLVYWAASKAFGGHGGFGLILDLIGLAAIPFWILAPLANYGLRFTPEGSFRTLLLILIIPAFLWSFVLIRKSMICGQNISMGKATFAVAGMWIFSVSAIYVFTP